MKLFAPCRAVPPLFTSALLSLWIAARLAAQAHAAAPSFDTPVPITSGGRSIVRIASTTSLPVLNANGYDTGADFTAPLDLNGDGRAWDIVTADHDTNLIRVHEQAIGGGTTYTDFDITAVNSPTDLAVRDIDGDGLPDIITCEAGNIVVYKNTRDPQTSGSLSFAAPVTYSALDVNGAPLVINKITVADVNGDELQDMIGVGTAVVNGVSQIQVAVFISSPNPNDPVLPAVVYTSRGTGDYVLAGNITRHGDDDGTPALDPFPEIIVGSNNGDNAGNNSGSGSFTTFLNKGDGTFGSDDDADPAKRPIRHDLFLHIHAMALGDLDGDGNRDLAIEDANIGSGLQTFLDIYLGAGDGNFGSSNGSDAFTFIGNNPNNDKFQGDIALIDLDGDGNLDLAVTDPVNTHGILAYTIDPQAANHAFFPFDNSNRVAVATGAGARAIGVTDANVDNKFDLIVANDDPNNLTLLTNSGAGGGGGTTLPPGRSIEFGDAVFTGDEGATISIPVLRGPDSTGQVLAFFSVSGSAVQFYQGEKTYDYTITDPPNQTQTLTFAEGETEKDITIVVAKSPAAEPTKNIVLTLLTPVGDAEVGVTNASTTINLIDGKPAILRSPAGLAVSPTNTVKTTPTNLRSLGVVVIGRTGSDWKFAVTEPLAAGAKDEQVVIQTSTDPVNGPWTDLTQLQRAGAKWTGSIRTLPIASKLYFRAFATATGFPDAPGAASKAYCVVAGPELAVNVTAVSDSDSSGDTVHEGEVITYHFHVANVGQGDATNAVLNIPLPAHTTYLNQTNRFGSIGFTRTKRGVITAAKWTFASIPHGGNVDEDLLVQVDDASAFSTKDPNKGFGYVIKATGYAITAPDQGVKAGFNLVAEFDTEILGPIDLKVTSDASGSVKPGDVITYTLSAANTSAVAVNGAVVQDKLPAGTVLETLYAFDQNFNSSSQPLPNPGPFSNPQIIYTRSPLGPSIDVSAISDPVIAALAIGLLKDKPGKEYDFLALRAQVVAQLAKLHRPPSDIQQFDDAIGELVAAQVVVPVRIHWNVPGLAPNSSITLKFQVRVLYDLQMVTQAKQASGTPQIIDNDYDFTIAGPNGKTISALYGHAPSALASDLTLTAPNAKPAIGLSKFALGVQNLNDPNHHGNGSQQIAGFGSVTTAVQNHGFDYELFYINTGSADARNVVIHDVIPAGAVLTGFFTQSENGGAPHEMNAGQFTSYDAAGNLIPVVDGTNITKVRSMDVRLSAVDNLTPLAAGAYGVIRYSVQPTAAPAAPGKPPTLIHAFGGYDSARRRSDPLQGTYISTTDLAVTVPASPDDLPVMVVADVSFDFHYTKASSRQYHAGDMVPFDFSFTQNGDISAASTEVDLVLPAGSSLVTTSPYAPQFTDGAQGAPTPTVSGQNVQLGFNTIGGHESHTFRIYLQINSPLDPTLASRHRLYFDVDPTIKGMALLPTLLASRRAAAAPAPAVSAATDKQTVRVVEATPPVLSIARSAPYTVPRSGEYTYTISFANTGDGAANGISVGMQVPFGTTFVPAGTTYGLIVSSQNGQMIPSANPHPYTTTPRSASQVKQTGPGPDIITWHFDTLPPHSTGTISMKVQARSDYFDNCVRDHSLYISASNAASALLSPNPIGTWVIGKSFDTSKWEVLACFCEHLGIPINKTTAPGLQGYVNALTGVSQVHAVGGLDALQLNNSAIVFPLGNDQVLVVATGVISNDGGSLIGSGASGIIGDGGASIVTDQGAGVISHDGGTLVYAGAASAITIKGIPGFADHDCSYLLDHASDIIAAGGGNIIAAGGGNLLTENGAGFSLVSNHDGSALAAISATNANIIAAGGGNIIAAGGGNIIAAGGGNVLNNPSAALIAQDGSSLLAPAGGSIIAAGGGNVVSHDGGSVISNDGGSLIKGAGE